MCIRDRYPVYLLFKGGKGVAVTIGVFLGLLKWWLALPLAVWAVAAKVSDYVSLASIALAAALPLAAWLAYHGQPQNYLVWGGALAASVFVIWRHRGNIKRLLNGTEPRRSSLKKTAGPTTGSQCDG